MTGDDSVVILTYLLGSATVPQGSMTDALVVQGRYGQAREILTQSPSEQAQGLLGLLDSDPDAYREQVINSDIY